MWIRAKYLKKALRISRQTTRFFLFFWLIVSSAYADVLNMSQAMNASTIMEVFIEKEHVRVELEIGLDDLMHFQNILPDSIYQKLTQKKRKLSKRLLEFSHTDLPLYADDKRLPVELISIAPRQRMVRDPITGEQTEYVAEKVIFAVLRYPIPLHANSLSITPPLNQKQHVKLPIGFVAYHSLLAINDFRYLVKKETVHLNWQDPWYSQFTEKSLQRYYNMPVSLFVYVEPYEVRKEIVIRPIDIQKYWHDLGLKKDSVIKPSDKEKMKKKVLEFLEDARDITINKKTVTMQVELEIAQLIRVI